jgi:acyl carrier protein
MADPVTEQIRAFVQRFVRRDVTDDLDIFESGYVNSMFAMELVSFIEATFGIVVESEDLELDNFRTVDAMAAFVARKTGAAAAS